MWCLVSIQDGLTYNLTPGKIHCVSRKAGDIVLANDLSISRKHAFLEVRTPASDGVLVWDDSSKYGTFVNGGIDKETKLNKDEKATIKEGGKVRFGIQNNTWVLKREVLCVCVTNLKAADKNKVKSIVTKLGGKVMDTWTQNSTYLTANSLRLTHEVICALASVKPIVLPAFWQCYSKMLTGSGDIAVPAKFVPPADDEKLLGKENLCLPNPARKALFRDKLFVFLTSKSFQELQEVVLMAGGIALELERCAMPIEELCEPHVVVVSCSKDQQTALHKKVLNKLQSQNRHAVPEEDVGLAIWKNSIAVHCNPTFSPSDLLRKPSEAICDQGSATMLVMNTEDDGNACKRPKFSDRVIPPSCSSSTNTSNTSDETCSITSQKTQPLPTPVGGFKRKRDRESTNGSSGWLNSQSIQADSSSISIKIKPEEEEDLFAEETSALEKSCISRGQGSQTSTQTDDEGFAIPSAPKRKRKKTIDDDGDTFELPALAPSHEVSDHSEEDPFGFSECDKTNRVSRRLNTTASLNISKDLFEATQASSSGACSLREAKRKERSDSDAEDPPAKRIPNAVNNFPNAKIEPKHVIFHGAFLSKSTIQSMKKDEDKVLDQTEGDDLAMRVSTKVVITPLIRPRNVNGNEKNISANNTQHSQKNFKKFRKVWSGSESRNLVNIIKIHAETVGGNRLSNGTNRNTEDEEEEDDPFLERPAPRRNGNVKEEEEDDEFALPTFSQVA